MGKKDVAEVPNAGPSGSQKPKSKSEKKAKGLAGSGLSKQKNKVTTITLEDGTEVRPVSGLASLRNMMLWVSGVERPCF